MYSEFEAARQLNRHIPAQYNSSSATIGADYGTASRFDPPPGLLSVSQISNVPLFNTTNSQQGIMPGPRSSSLTNAEMKRFDDYFKKKKKEFIEKLTQSVAPGIDSKNPKDFTLNEYLLKYLNKMPFNDYYGKTGYIYLLQLKKVISRLGSKELKCITRKEMEKDFAGYFERKNKNFMLIVRHIFTQAVKDEIIPQGQCDSLYKRKPKCKQPLHRQQPQSVISRNNVREYDTN